MKLKKIIIKNFRSIVNDAIVLDDFTFFVGKNNYGKSNYLKAIDHLLSFTKTYSKVREIQYNEGDPVIIEGWFDGVKMFTPNLKDSKHKVAVESLLDDNGLIRLRLVIGTNGDAETLLVNPKDDKTVNPTGWSSICKKLFPETIFVPATADTADELQEKATTALSKIKKEVMQQFFTSLSSRIDSAFEPIDKFLNGQNEDKSEDLIKLETDFSEEMMGEFSSAKPSIRFSLPDSSFIGKGMKINLHDGFHDCEIEQKGSGLQRTALFALIRLLSKHALSNQIKPAPLFLIEEIEAFLHPSAQKKLADGMASMSKNYQAITTTHSPFVLSEKLLVGYRKVSRTEKGGTISLGPQTDYEEFKKSDYDTVKNSLAHSGNLVSLFSDTVVIVEGKEDAGFYPTVEKLLQNDTAMLSFVNTTTGGNSGFHMSYNFFKLMGFKSICVIGDLDCLFDTNFKNLLKVISINSDFVDEFRSSIGHTGSGQPGAEYVLANIEKINSEILNKKINELSKNGVFILRHGTPENYYSDAFRAIHTNGNPKKQWELLTKKEELNHLDEIESILSSINRYISHE